MAVAHRPATSLHNTLAALQAIGIHDTERDELFKVLLCAGKDGVGRKGLPEHGVGAFGEAVGTC